MNKIDKKIGIVMTYYNRQYQLNKTLETINKQRNDDVFVVIVDDNSYDNIILPPCNFDVKVIRIGKEKNWTNPEPAYNIGFLYLIDNTTCEIIINQNAECYHVGEVLNYARENTTIDNYITFGCYSLDYENTFNSSFDLLSFIEKHDVSASHTQGDGWYNHPIHRPKALENCSSIHKINLLKLNGYDERLSIDGIGYGDDYLIDRIRFLGLNVEITESPFVVHQWHGYNNIEPDIYNALLHKNYELYQQIVLQKTIRGIHIFTKDMSYIRYRNILFINPWSKDMYPPPSIGYLQAAVKKCFSDSGVKTTACNIVDLDDVLSKNTFDLIAVSFHSFSVRYAVEIRNKIKRGKLICGGHHSTSLPEQMLSIGYDQVVIGEGENAIIDIILGEEQKIFRSKSTYFRTINDIPIPDYTGLGDVWESGYPIISSRGCPFICNFCASSFFWDRKWYMRSVDNVINEILHRINNFGMKTWMFEDDNFTLNKKRAMDICSAIVSNNIKMDWQCASRSETLSDEELCKALVDAGCKTVWLGIESLSQDSLDRCKKNTTVKKMLDGIETAERLELKTMSQFIVGLPGDTIDNIRETANNIKHSSISSYGCNYAWILPNTDIHDKAVERGFKDSTYLTNGVSYYTYEQPMETLTEWVNILYGAKS